MAVKHGACLLILRKRSRLSKRSAEETSAHFLLGAQQDQRLGAEQDRLPCGSTGTSSGNCQEVETRMVRWHVTRHDIFSKTFLEGTVLGG